MIVFAFADTANKYFTAISIFAFFTSIGFFYFFYLYYFKTKKQQKKILAEKTILQCTIEIQEQLFVNIRQQIHDNIGQTLSLAKLNMNTLSEKINIEKLNATEELLGKAILELRQLSKNLYEEETTSLTLTNAISAELQSLEKITPLRTSFVAPPYEIILTHEQSIIIFRTVQEILNVIVKLSKAGETCVEIISSTDIVSINIQHKGKNFSLDNIIKENTFERLGLIKAKLTYNSKSSNETNFKILIPAPGNI